MTLQNRYEKVCNEYAVRFCKKQMFDETGYSWVADEIGGVLECAGFYFNFQDVVWDINSNQPKELILKWIEDCLDEQKTQNGIINYFSYSKGLRFTDLNK